MVNIVWKKPATPSTSNSIAKDRSIPGPLPGGCVSMQSCWVAGEDLRPRRRFCLSIMSEATWIWMNNFFELSHCGLLLGSWAGGNYGDEFYYPCHRSLLPTGLPSSSVIIWFSCIIWSHVLSLGMLVDSEELCCPHIWHFPPLSGPTLTLNFHPKHVHGPLHEVVYFVKFWGLLLAENPHVLFRDQSTQD